MSTSKLEQADQQRQGLIGYRNSNEIAGNTLTQSETEMVLERGITVGGKTMVEHLEVIGHRDAIALIEELTQTNTLIRAYEIRQIHALIMGVNLKGGGRAIPPDSGAVGGNGVCLSRFRAT